MINTKIAITIIFFALFLHMECSGQIPLQKNTTYKGFFSLGGKITLDSLTKYVHKLSGMRFAFNSSKVKGSKEINFVTRTYSFLALLERIKNTTSLYYTFYNGYVIFQDNPPKNKNIFPGERETNEYVSKKQNSSLKLVSKFSNSTKKEKRENWVKRAPVHLPGQAIAKEKGKTSMPEYADTLPDFSPIKIVDTIAENTYALHPGHTIPVNRLIDSSFLNKKNPDDSVITVSIKENIKRNKKLHIGLQWTVPFPFHGFKYYFVDTDERKIPYHLLIPGVWVSKFFTKKSELMLSATLSQEYFAGNKVLYTFFSGRSQTNTDLNKKTISLSKTSNIVAGMQYNFHISNRWAVGLGINYNRVNNALLVNEDIAMSNDSVTSSSVYAIKRSSDQWSYLRPSFFSGKLEAAYKFKRFNAGCSIVAPLSNILSPVTEISVRTVNGQLFLRWKIN